MSRIRSVKPELFTHDGLFEAERDYQLPLRLAFIGLFTQCDQWGRFRWEPKRLKLSILPFDDVDIVQIFEALALRGFIKKYEVADKWYGCIPSWAKHQRITRPEHPSGIPTPEGFVFERPKRKALKPENVEVPPSHEALQVLEPLVSASHAVEAEVFDKPFSKIVNPEPAFVPTKAEDAYHTACTECQSVHTECAQGCNTNDTKHELVHTKNVLGCNTVCTEHEQERTWCTGNREYGNGIGNKEYGTGNNIIVAPKARPRSGFEAESIFKIFEHWQTVMKHPNTKLDPKRKVCIGKALDWGYSVEQLCQAITGCSLTPYNQGQNDRGQRYDGLCLILRDSDQIDRFIDNYHCPPRPVTEAERKTNANVQSLQRWAAEKMAEASQHGRA